MSVPTFASSSLLTDSEQLALGPPTPRASLATLPGVLGALAQQFGQGARTFQGQGILEATSATSYALAVKALRVAVNTLQQHISDAPSAFVDDDGNTWNNCLLSDYRMAGKILVGIRSTTPAAYVARVEVSYVVTQLDTSPPVVP